MTMVNVCVYDSNDGAEIGGLFVGVVKEWNTIFFASFLFLIGVFCSHNCRVLKRHFNIFIFFGLAIGLISMS